MNSRIRNYPAHGVFLTVLILTACVYLPGLAGDYAFDDFPNLLDNKRLQLDSLDLESLEVASFSSGSGLLRRPVSMASFALNRYFFGIDPFSYKVINLAIHLLTGLGLYLLARVLLRSYRLEHRPDLSNKVIIWLPVVICGLWLVHPLNLTSVLYIVQRMTSLSTLFMVLGLYLYTLGRWRMVTGNSGLHLPIIGLLLFGTLALFSKESGALLPLYMLVIELALFRFRNSVGKADKRIIAFFLVSVALPASAFLLYLATSPGTFLSGYSIRDYNLYERLLTELRVLMFYLKMTVIPSLSELGLYHDDIAISRGLLDPPSTLFALLTIAAMVISAFLLLNKQPLVSLGILWFFAGHVLESTIIPLEIAHEHRNYLADFGIILTISAAVLHAPLPRLAPVLRTATPLVFIVLFSATTWLRAEQWADNVSHAVYEARHHPDSFRAVSAAGRIHAKLAINGNTDSENMAYQYLERARILDKSAIMPTVTLIMLSHILEKPADQAWFDDIRNRLSSYPTIPSDLIAIMDLTSCINVDCDIGPELMEPIFNAIINNRYGHNAQALTIYGYYSINKRNDFYKGLELFNKAVKLDPKEPVRWTNLIKLLTVMQMYDEAEQELIRFMNTDTHGGNAKDYQALQEAIDRARSEHISSTTHLQP